MDNSTVLLKRLLLAKEPGFLLVLDSLTQSSHYLIQEVLHQTLGAEFIALSFETANRPQWATHWIECLNKSTGDIHKEILSISTGTKKTVIVIDSLNYLSSDKLTGFILGIMLANTTIVATLHQLPRPQPTISNYPNAITLLLFIANAIFEVTPCVNDNDKLESSFGDYLIMKGWNSTAYEVELTHRRKLGRSIKHFYIIDSSSHLYTPKKATKDDEDDEKLFHDLTTFNLSTSSRQKLAREQVELPFMQAQDSLGSSGGAIVYEFEKDDDYDEEDPYEDPF